MASQKLYHRRQVAESDAKACWICYKPSPTVLITPDNEDWFHICASHLKDRKFATPQDGPTPEELAKKKREEELEKEIEAVKKEYADKQAEKLKKRKKWWDWSGTKQEDKDKAKKEDENEEKEKEAKVKDLEMKRDEASSGGLSNDGPRVFELHKDFQLMRNQKKREAEQRKRQAEISRRNLETLKTAGAFPQVPSNLP